MSYNPTSTPGQKTMANSDPVVIASDQSAVPVSGTVTANTGLTQPLTDTQLRATPVPISGTVSTSATADTFPATQNITAQDVVSATATGANSQSIITGTATAGSVASFTISTLDSIKVQVTGTWTGTLQPEVSLDGGTTWFINGVHQTGTAYTVASFTANFGGGLNVSGATNFRLRSTAAWTGTATVKIVGTVNPNSVYIANGLNLQDATTQSQKLIISAAGAAKVDGSAVTQPVSGTVTANAGTNLNTSALALDATLTGGTQKTKLVDTGGTNVGTIKAASTAVAATDTALAVGLHPTSPLPAGTNALGSLTAGTALIGKVGIDQTTPGTTNAVTDTKLPASAASADALTNPTITQIGADNMVFNGTTWDRQRGMSLALTTGDTGAKTATGNGATITNVGNKGIQIVINMGAVTGTTPTAVLKVQGSVDGGTNWYDVPGATTASLVATGIWGITIYPGATPLAGTTTTGSTVVVSNVIPRTWRMVWTLGGTTPSFTITSITYNYIPN